MAKNSNASFAYEALVSIILPEGILDVFEVVNVEEEHTGFIEETGLERRVIHIHLDERDLRSKEWHDLHPNGFTEEHCINDFPIRDRKVVLHVRRRRWKDKDGKNVVLPRESLTASGTSYSKEFADVLKKYSDTYPIAVRSLERYFKVNGPTLEKNYKEHLSGYRQWNQLAHASDWVLLAQNMGEKLSIDESMHQKDLFTFLSNKDGHGKKGTLIAAIRGTKASVVVEHLMKIPEDKRLAVKEVTMDYSDSMYSIVTQVFPNADIVIDCFHVMKNQLDGLDAIRMRFKRKAIAEQSKEKKEFNRKKKARKKARARYRKAHPKKTGEKRGRPRLRANEKFVPKELPNGDTKVELFTRVKRVLPQSGEKWRESQKVRANMVFEFAPKLKEAYSLVCKLRAIFRNKKLTKETAKEKLHAWYKEVSASRLPEMTSAMKTLKSKENEVLNYFVNRSTNAAAESLNSKMKGFRSELRGVRDLPFFLYRCTMIFG